MTDKRVHYAATVGELNSVRAIIENNSALVHHLDEEGRTPLHYAATHGRIEVAEFLLSAGADIDAKDKWARTPLFLSVFEEPLVMDHTPMVEFLVSKGAICNCRDYKGFTPLHMAAAFSEPGTVPSLLSGGADVNAVTEDGNTPLHYAVRFQGTEIVNHLLIRPKIRIDIRNGEGLTPRDIAIQVGDLELEELLDRYSAS